MFLKARKYFTLIGLLIITSFWWNDVYATHLVGGNITYKYLSNLKYEVTLSLYRECGSGSAAAPTSVIIYYSSSSCSRNGYKRFYQLPGTGNDISPVCDPKLSSCNGGSLDGVQEYLYRDTITLPKACTDWKFYWSTCCRNYSISTIFSPGSAGLYLEATLNNKDFPTNSSPVFLNSPVGYLCLNNPFTFNHGAKDADGDSLVFSLYTPRISASSTVNYFSGYSYLSPLKSNPALKMDSLTGDITGKPTQSSEVTVMGVKVEEYRHDSLIGIIYRDMQLKVISCNKGQGGNTKPNNNPIVSGIDSTQLFDTVVCPFDSINFKIYASDIDTGDSLTMSWNGSLPGAKFIVKNNHSEFPHAIFKWLSTSPKSSTRFNFTVTVKDNNCPTNGSITKNFSILVIPTLVVKLPAVGYVPCNDSTKIIPVVTGGDSSKYLYQWSTGDTTLGTWVTKPDLYFFEVGDSGRCSVRDSIQILKNLGANFHIDPSFKSYSDCVGDTVHFFDSSRAIGATIVDRHWYFGDGDSATGTIVNHRYPDTGQYTVTLTVQDSFGCLDTLYQPITIDPFPVADFKYIYDCAYDSVQFLDKTTIPRGSIVHWEWYFENDTAFEKKPKHLFGTGGSYPVKLIVASGGSCFDTIQKPISVAGVPDANFVSAYNCVGDTSQFTDLSTVTTGTIIQWHWDFNGADSSSLQNPKYYQSSIGTYRVTLIVKSDSGCYDTTEQTFNKFIKANYNVFVTDTAICKGDTLFLDKSKSPSQAVKITSGPYSSTLLTEDFEGSLTQWTQETSDDFNWSANTGYTPSSNTGPNTDHTSGSGKRYYYTEASGRSQGDEASLLSQTYAVSKFDSVFFSFWYHMYGNTMGSLRIEVMPTSTQTWSTVWSVSGQQQRSYTANYKQAVVDLSSYNSDSIRIKIVGKIGSGFRSDIAIDDIELVGKTFPGVEWDPPIGVSDAFSEEAYLFPDTTTAYNIDIKFGDCKQTETLNVNVAPNFNIPLPTDTFLCSGDSVIVDAKPDNIYSYSYEWTRNGNFYDSVSNPVFKLVTPGTFHVEVASSLGCIKRDDIYVDIISFGTSVSSVNSLCLNDTIQLSAKVNPSDTAGRKFFYTWSPSTDISSTTVSDPYVYPDSAITYFVDIKDSTSSCVINDSVPLTHNLYADFEFQTSCDYDPMQFTDQSVVNNNDNISEWNWDFGDGTTSNVQNPTHQFPADTFYLVTLVVKTSKGCSDTVRKQVRHYANISSAFSYSDLCSKDSINLTNHSAVSRGNITTNKWIIDNSDTLTRVNPKYDFSPATHSIKLVIISDKNCSDTSVQNLDADVFPTVNFSFTEKCDGTSIPFKDKSSHSSLGIASRDWDFGDGNTSMQKNPSHLYSAAGFYQVTLIATTDSGCSDTVSKQVEVYPVPEPAFTINDSDQCLSGNNFAFSNGSTIQYGTQSYVWNFGNGDTSHSSSPNYSYSVADTYTVTLTATSGEGCSDKVSKEIIVFPDPQADFNFTIECVGDTTKFTDASNIPSGNITSWDWIFGDGKSSVSQNAAHLYGSAGTFSTELVVESSFGCTDTMAKTINVGFYPQAAINYYPSCIEDTIIFEDNSIIGGDSITSWDWDFGDGVTSTMQNTTHQYTSDSFYDVTLEVKTPFGCADTVHKQVSHYAIITSSFNHSNLCSKDSIQLTSLSHVNRGSIATTKWIIDNADTLNRINPNYDFTPTNHSIMLVVISDKGCSDTSYQSIDADVFPTMDFSFTEKCDGNAIPFNDKSSHSSLNIASRIWDFGDGDSSTLKKPSHLYNAAGFYNVILISTTDSGCSDTLTKQVEVYPVPQPAFTINDSDQCLSGNNFSFSNNSTIQYGSQNFLWDFGNGDTSHSVNPTYSYSVADTYTVTLTAMSGEGCSEVFSRSLVVYPDPQADFIFTIECVGDTTQFTDASNISSGNITSWNWTFGDGNGSATQNPVNLYTTPGLYPSKLLVESSFGCKDSIEKNINVGYYPTAQLYHYAPCNGSPVIFRDKSTIAGDSITAWNWDFDDGKFSTQQNINHQYDSSRYYTTRLIVSSVYGCSDTDSVTFFVWPKLTVGYAYDPVCFGDTSVFTDTSYINAGNLTSWKWHFGDGDSVATQHTKHLYANPGSYDVSLVVETDLHCIDTLTKTIRVGAYPTADFSNAITCFGEQMSFTNNSGINPDTIVAYEWTFGDGDSSFAYNVAHLYSKEGFYNVKLVAYSDLNCTDTVSKTIEVYPTPVAGFSINDSLQCYNQNTFDFTNNSNIPYDSMLFTWNFGDGNSTSTINTQHIYGNEGSYKVELFVESNRGCKDSSSVPVVVYPSPDAKFTTNDTDQCLYGNSVKFNNKSKITGGTITYNWDFDDGSISTSKSPTHQYQSEGYYNTVLIVTSDKACTDTANQNLVIYPMPHVSYSINDSVQCFTGNEFDFINLSSIAWGNMSYVWDFGDGDTASTIDVTHNYSSEGFYTTELLIASDHGCKDSSSIPVIVYPSPEAEFTTNDTDQCLYGNSVDFNNKSKISSGTMTYIWDFGDKSYSTTKNPVHHYKSEGYYNTELVVTSDKSCTDTTDQDLVIYPMPKVLFTVNDSGQCLSGNQFRFTNLSSISWGTLSYVWYFGNGDTSHAIHPVYSYANHDTFEVKVLAFSNNQCVDSFSRLVIVYPDPQVSFSINDSDQCLSGNDYQFTNQSNIASGSLSYFWTFGDGDTSTLTNPDHSYSIHGIFPVKLVATSDLGCIKDETQPVEVYPMPEASFAVNMDTQCLNENYYEFYDSSTIAYGNLSYYWEFGDGNNSTFRYPDHKYSNYDTFNVRFMVTSGKGCTDSAFRDMVVRPSPQTSFAINDPSQCFDGHSFDFTNTSSIGAGSLSYKWNFDDTSFISKDIKQYHFNEADSYRVKLVAVSDKGCSDSLIKDAIVNPMPKADFATTDSSQCLSGNKFSFLNLTSIKWGSVGYDWDFKDGFSSSLINPTHAYFSDGVYRIELIANSDQGCADTIEKIIEVNPMPVSKFAYIIQCAGDSTTFTLNSSVKKGLIDSVIWSFGDGDSSGLANPKHLYAGGGTYSASLISVSDQGCEDTLNRNVKVGYYPTADFSLSSNCTDENILFNNLTSITSDSITKWNWDFGDGTTSIQDEPKHLFDNYGTYKIQLIAISEFNCKDTIQKTIDIEEKPIAGFINTTGCAGELTQFTDTSKSPNGTLSDWEWNFGDGDNELTQNPSHIFGSAGKYPVTMVVKTQEGCSDTATNMVEVGYFPTANFRIDGERCFGEAVNFKDSSSIGGDKIKHWIWDFGDSLSATVTDPAHFFAKDSTYDVKLIVSTDFGCKDSIIKVIKVNSKPAADFDNNPPCLASPIYFTDKTTNIEGAITKYNWDFDDGGSSNLKDPIHTYLNTQKYDVTLVVESEFSCKDTVVKPVAVLPSPKASYTANALTQCFSGNELKLQNTSTSQAGPLTYLWLLGDGDSTTNESPTHSFQKVGKFSVKLYAFTSNGCIDSVIKQVTILEHPQAAFTLNQFEQCLNENEFAPVNNSTFPNTSLADFYEWDFGNGDKSQQKSPIYSYPTYGTFTIKLIAKTDFGCADSVSHPVKINPSPEADFVVPPACLNNPSEFTDRSTIDSGTIEVYYWDFADGKDAIIANPGHTYQSAGKYPVKLRIFSDEGCPDSVIKQAVVYGKPQANHIIRATVESDEHVLVEWRTMSIEQPGQYILIRLNEARQETDTIGIFSKNILSAFDYDVAVDKYSYIYSIVIKDSCGKYSDFSNVGQTILLDARTDYDKPSLSWNSYVEWPEGVEFYEIQRLENSFFETIDTVSGLVNTYQDSTYPDFQMDLCYRVIAHARDSFDLVSVSNEDCVPAEMRVFVPNAFSPNGDGINDVFYVKGTYISRYQLKIFNRWGERVFESHDLNEGWDGYYNGEIVPIGIYHFILFVEGAEGQQKRIDGSISVIR